MKFPERLRNARRASGLTFTTLAERAGMTTATTSTLERGANVPRIDTVERLARGLGLSPCFLAFGIEPVWEPSDGLLCQGVGQRVADTRQGCGLSLRMLARQAETSVNFIRMTEAGATMPNLANLEALARSLNVSPAWLAYGTGPREPLPRRGAKPTPAPEPAAP